MLVCQSAAVLKSFHEETVQDLRTVVRISDDEEETWSSEKAKHNEPLNLVCHSRNSKQQQHPPDIPRHAPSHHGGSPGWSPEAARSAIRDEAEEWRSAKPNVRSAEGMLHHPAQWSNHQMVSALKSCLFGGERSNDRIKADCRGWPRNAESPAEVQIYQQHASPTSVHSPEVAITPEEAIPSRHHSDTINTWSAKAVLSPMYHEPLNGTGQNHRQNWTREQMNSAIHRYFSTNRETRASYSPETIDLTSHERVTDWAADYSPSGRGDWPPSMPIGGVKRRSAPDTESTVAPGHTEPWFPATRGPPERRFSGELHPAVPRETTDHQAPRPPPPPYPSSNNPGLQNSEYPYQKTMSPGTMYPSAEPANRWSHERGPLREPEQLHSTSVASRYHCFKCGQWPPELHRDARICSDPIHFFGYYDDTSVPGNVKSGSGSLKARRSSNVNGKRRLNKYKDRKSYCAEIAGILLKKGSLLLAEIYDEYENFGYNVKRPSANSWKNSIRHNLSLHDCFIKVPTRDKGFNRWAVHPQWVPHFQRLISGANMDGDNNNKTTPPQPNTQTEIYRLEIDSDSEGENNKNQGISAPTEDNLVSKNINEADTTTIEIDLVKEIKKEPDDAITCNDTSDTVMTDESNTVEVTYDNLNKKRMSVTKETETQNDSGQKQHLVPAMDSD